MYLPTFLSLLVLALLQLGVTQEFVLLTRNQLREEIRAGVAAALSSGNQSPSPLNFHINTSCSCDGLSTLQEAVGRLQQQVNITAYTSVDLQEAVGRLQQQINVSAVDTSATLQQAVGRLQQHMNISADAYSRILREVCTLRHPGRSTSYPAISCREIKEDDPNSPSGYYYIQSNSSSFVRAYCDMTRSCGGITGGWMRVTKLDMTNSSHTCPEGLKLLSTPKRLCAMNIDGGGCSSATFDLHGIRYTHVCGKIIGYQQKTPDAFAPYWHNRHLTIDDNYVDGISLTHGRNPRKHIWTFAAALHEIVTATNPFDLCPCTNIHNRLSIPIPPYVGNDYFCDTASENHYQFKFYPSDPLWDGQGCGRLNTCCSFNNPPWFMKELPSSTRDNIEMRLCTDYGRADEDINFEAIELYVL